METEYDVILKNLLESYSESVQEIEKKKTPKIKLFGFGKSAADEPCHEEMDREIAGLIRRAEEEGALPEEKAEIVRVLLGHAADYQGPEYARILLVAIQRHVIPWIPELGGEARAEILAWYQQKYPRRKRFPVQERIIAALKAGTSRR